ncbi:MAG: preprotein translocase subunit SecE [Candidatus Saccharibacteria bacterium]|jgi:preprotein translocase subunit SecE
MQHVRRYISSSIEELKRVVWPTRQQAISLTIIVLVFTAIVAAYLSGLDLIFRNALQRLLAL